DAHRTIDGAAGRKRHDDLDRPRWIILRVQRAGCERGARACHVGEREGDAGSDLVHHAMLTRARGRSHGPRMSVVWARYNRCTRGGPLHVPSCFPCATSSLPKTSATDSSRCCPRASGSFRSVSCAGSVRRLPAPTGSGPLAWAPFSFSRSEEHTSVLH